MTPKEFLTATPSQLARDTGGTSYNWDRWLKGKRSMNSKHLINASKKLGIDAAILDDLIKTRIEMRNDE